LTPHRFHSLVSASVLAVAVGVSAGCGDGDGAPDRLMDGSVAAAPPVELEDVEQPAVLTKVRIVQPSERAGEERSASCLQRGRGSERPRGSSVERIGVHSETVTFEEESGRAIFGCDNSPGPREENRRWCGGAYGQLYGGHLRDPRLSMAGCRTADGDPMGFVWVEPEPQTRYVVVEQPGYAEAYEARGRLPVRIATTSGVIIEGSRATFELSEHDRTGRVLRTHRIDARVAG